MSGIVVTGVGIVSAVGQGVAANEAALRADRVGLGALRRFSSPRCGQFPVAEVDLASVPGRSRTEVLALPALEEALASAGLGERGPIGLSLGCTVGGMPESEEEVAALLGDGPRDPSVWLRHECGATTSGLARRAHLEGPALTVSTACSSGAQAIANGAELLLSGLAPAVAAGGVDALCRLTLNGFASLLAIDPAGCRPFDIDRKGMSLGEGAAFLILERASDARARGAEVLAHLAGWSNTCDAHHPTAPHPEGRGAERAMRQALVAAGRTPADVDYVNAHGTGTPENDRAEGQALRALFGDDLPAISSTKRVFGHTLGAAGAIEAVVSVLALARGFLPGNPGFTTLDPHSGIEPLRATRAAEPSLVLSNSFGFGGNNTALCFGEGA